MHYPQFNTLRQSAITTAIGLVIGTSSSVCLGALASDATLELISGVSTLVCPAGGTPPSCDYGITQETFTGTWFSMDQSKLGTIEFSEVTLITASDPGTMILGTSQTASGSHGGGINGTENPAFDVWEFFGATGLDYTNSPPTIISTAGNQVSLDLSGWNVTWNGIPAIDMGGGLQDCGTTNDGECVAPDTTDIEGTFDNGTSIAFLDCYETFAEIPEFDQSTFPDSKPGVGTIECDGGKFFELRYNAVVPQGDPSNFGGVAYAINMVGQIEGGTTTTTTVPTTTTTGVVTTTTVTPVTPTTSSSSSTTTSTTTTLPPDTTPPVITINGDNPTNVTQGENYVDEGATATDDRDGDVTVVTNPADVLAIDTSVISSYTVTYNSADSASNKSSATRIVNVVYANETKKGKFGCTAGPVSLSGSIGGDTTLLAGFLAWLGLSMRRRRKNES